MQKARILIVDDEALALLTLSEILQLEGYEVTAVTSGDAAVRALRASTFNLMILDLKMPGMSGLELLPKALDQQPQLKVIILTAYASLDSAIMSIRYRVTDYLLKPISPPEIIQSVNRAFSPWEHTPSDGADRSGAASGAKYSRVNFRSGGAIPVDVTIDFLKREILTESVEVELTPTEARIISVLYEHRGLLVMHDELVWRVQGYKVALTEAAQILRPLMSRLRKKLSDFPGGDEWIQNVRGSGYVFEVVKE